MTIDNYNIQTLLKVKITLFLQVFRQLSLVHPSTNHRSAVAEVGCDSKKRHDIGMVEVSPDTHLFS
jgi:hypothetical protein